MNKRKSGVLLHITSLPSEYGIGDLGPEAYRFADFLSESGQSCWQVLPVNPTLNIFGNSPYSSYSAFAGNKLLISPELLYINGLLSAKDLKLATMSNELEVRYESVSNSKSVMLHSAYENFISDHRSGNDFTEFCENNSSWLDDFALFVCLKKRFGNVSWNNFPQDISMRQSASLEKYKTKLINSINRVKFEQYIFFDQWNLLKEYCNNINIEIIGDLPIYVNHDSADVWSNPDIFKLDDKHKPAFVSGVPPDYFSETGQLWGNPVYDWDSLRSSHYKWWMERLEQNFRLFDIIRLDHFRGFVAYWEIPASENTAINGQWIEAPAEDFFSLVMDTYHPGKFIAEDLGTITGDVIKIRDRFGMPGMNILQFAFGDDYPNGSYLPHNHIKNSVVYTGTHDNNTLVGWWNKECTDTEKTRVKDYLKNDPDNDIVNWIFIGIAMSSIADTVILPMQDLLGLDESARMNTPSTATGNWEWRLNENYPVYDIQGKLRKVTADNRRL